MASLQLQQSLTHLKNGKSILSPLGCADDSLSQQASGPAVNLQNIHQHENPAMVKKSLEDFDREVKIGMYPAYELAADQDRSYVDDPLFRLKFLRANMNNPKQSVHQMINFLRLKGTYFGFDKIGRDITLDDLNQKEVKLMMSSLYHIHDGTDVYGRVILYPFLSKLDKSTCSTESLIRINYYIFFNILIPMPAVQTKGLVVVYYDTVKAGDTFTVPDGMNSMTTVTDFMDSLPIRYSATHLCIKRGKGTQDLRNSYHGIAVKTLPQHALATTQIHDGDDKELQGKLREYGIPIDYFPVDAKGHIRKGIGTAWFQMHVAKDRQDNWRPSSIKEILSSVASEGGDDKKEKTNETTGAIKIISLQEDDVVFGRGRPLQDHPGNVRFRKYLEKHRNDYENAPHYMKGKTAANFARALIAKGVRFLELTNSFDFVETDFDRAAKRVGNVFRELRKQIKKRKRKAVAYSEE